MAKYECLSGNEVCRRMLRRRHLDQDETLNTKLNRCLRLPQLTAYGLGHTIGVGLYVLTGTLVKDHAGAATCIAYLVAGLTCFFTAACYAEFATLVPRAGSAYVYTYLMLGEFPAFIIGWTMISDMLVSMAAISKALSGTINLMSNNSIAKWSEANLVSLHNGDSTILEKNPDLVSFAFILFLIIITMSGVKFSLTFNTVIAVVQLTFLLAIMISAFVVGNPGNIPKDGFAPFGLIGVLDAVGIAVFAFSGFESMATASEEAADPRKDLPRAIYISLGICVFLYFMAPLSLNYLTPRLLIDISAPFPTAFLNAGIAGLMWFSAVATIIATGAAKIVAMHSIPRMFYAIAKDGLLFPFMAWIDPCTQVPLISLFIGGTLCILLAVFINLRTLADFTSIGVIFCYFFIGLDLMILRYLYRREKRETFWDLSMEDAKVDAEEEKPSNKRLMEIRVWAHQAGFVRRFPKLVYESNFKFILKMFILSALFLGAAIKGFMIMTGAWIALPIVLAVIFVPANLVCFALLCIYEPKIYDTGFVTKFMPLSPCVTLFCNGLIFFTLGWETWLRFAIWTAIGVLIYFGFGIWHSKAEQGPHDETALITIEKEIPSEVEKQIPTETKEPEKLSELQ